MKLTLIILLVLPLVPLMAHGQEKTPQGRVVLEEEEITLLDDKGKEIEKRYVSKDGVEKSAIVKQVREKVLKGMGLKSISETKGHKELNQRYLNEQRKYVKVRELKPLTLKFVDKNNKVIKEVPISPTESWRAKGFSVGENEATKKKIEQRISREAFVSKFQNSAIVSELSSGFVVPVSASEASSAERGGGELGTDSSIEYYDSKGNMRWKKKSDPNLIFYPVNISETGDIVAAIRRCELGCRKTSEAGVPLQELDVYDSSGKEVLVLPLSKEMCFSYNGGFWLSQKGDYVKVDCVPEKGFPKSVFIDVKARQMWRAPYLAGIGRGDDGYEIRDGDMIRIVATDDQMRNKSQSLDLGKISWEKLQ